MGTTNQEGLVSEALKIARDCDADSPRYVALIRAMNTILGWTDGNQITIWVNQNDDRWITLSYDGPLKGKNYQQLFSDENLCLLLSDTEKMNIEVKRHGCRFQASVNCPPTNPIVCKSKLPDCDKNASSATIAYQIGSDKRALGIEKVEVIANHFCNRFPGLTISVLG